MSSYLRSQFINSTMGQPVLITGDVDLGIPVQAQVSIQDITYTAVEYGDAGNNISIEYIGGGTAGSEVVTVVGNAITVQIEDGVSTANQIEAAIIGSGPASALVTAAPFTNDPQSIEPQRFLSGGADNIGDATFGMLYKRTEKIGIGTYKLYFDGVYKGFGGIIARIYCTQAIDIIPQVGAVSIVGPNDESYITIRLLRGATPVDIGGIEAVCRLMLIVVFNKSELR